MIVKNVLLFLLLLLVINGQMFGMLCMLYTPYSSSCKNVCECVCAGSIGAECLSPLHVCTCTCINSTVFVCINVCL